MHCYTYVQLLETAEVEEGSVGDLGEAVPGQTERDQLALVDEGPLQDDGELVAVQSEGAQATQVDELVVADELHHVVAQVEVGEVRQQVVDLGVDPSERAGSALEPAQLLEI